jgi:branched-chain amino acid transport system substrate-binding protein
MRWAWLLVVLGCAGPTPPEVYVIGHVAPLTGSQAADGRSARHGVAVAVQAINADEKQWLDGRRVTVLHGDTASSPTGWLPTGVRLSTLNRVSALIGGLTPTDVADVSKAAQSERLTMSGTTGIMAIGTAASPTDERNLLALGLAPEALAPALTKLVRDAWKAKTVVVVVDRSVPLSATLTELLTTALAPIVVERTDKLPDAVRTADVVLALMAPEPAANLVSQVSGRLVAFGVERTAHFRPVAGLHVVTAYLPTLDTEANQTFVKAYREAYQQPPDVAAALAYDATRLLLENARLAKTFALPKLREQLHTVKDWPSVSGPLSVIDGKVRRPVLVGKFADGAWQLVWRSEP